MDSLRRADSNLSISSIISDSNLKDEDSETTIKSNSMLKLLPEAISDIIAENSVLGNEILEILNVLKFDLKFLSPDIRDGLQTIAAILKSEGLVSADETVLQLCLKKKEIQNKMNERERRLLKAKYNAAFTKYNVLDEKLSRLQKEIEQNQDLLQSKTSDIENTESNRILRLERLHDYRETIKKLEEELDELNCQEIGLDQTLQKSSILMEKMNDLNELNKELEKYGDLPPNFLQAKNVLENKKRELKEIENLLYEKINE